MWWCQSCKHVHVSGHIAFSSSLLLSSAASAEPGSGLKTSPVANQHMALTRTTHETAVGYQLLGTTLFPNSLLCCYETSSVGSLLQMLITLTANEKKIAPGPIITASWAQWSHAAWAPPTQQLPLISIGKGSFWLYPRQGPPALSHCHLAHTVLPPGPAYFPVLSLPPVISAGSLTLNPGNLL